MASRWALLGDELVSRNKAVVDLEDRGYQFGDGVYEVIRVYGGTLFRVEEHLTRLERSLRELRIPFPDCRSRALSGARKLLEAETILDGYVYLQITRGSAPRMHQFPDTLTQAVMSGTASPLPRNREAMGKGVRVLLTEDLRWLRNDIKSLNLLGAVLAKERAKEASCFEALLYRGKKITEGSSSNAFIVLNNRLRTHPVDNQILRGITRDLIIDLAGKIGCSVEDKAFTKEELLGAQEAFLTGTTTEIMPIVAVDSGNGKIHTLGDGKPGEITRKLQRKFQELLSK